MSSPGDDKGNVRDKHSQQQHKSRRMSQRQRQDDDDNSGDEYEAYRERSGRAYDTNDDTFTRSRKRPSQTDFQSGSQPGSSESLLHRSISSTETFRQVATTTTEYTAGGIPHSHTYTGPITQWSTLPPSTYGSTSQGLQMNTGADHFNTRDPRLNRYEPSGRPSSGYDPRGDAPSTSYQHSDRSQSSYRGRGRGFVTPPAPPTGHQHRSQSSQRYDPPTQRYDALSEASGAPAASDPTRQFSTYGQYLAHKTVTRDRVTSGAGPSTSHASRSHSGKRYHGEASETVPSSSHQHTSRSQSGQRYHGETSDAGPSTGHMSRSHSGQRYYTKRDDDDYDYYLPSHTAQRSNYRPRESTELDPRTSYEHTRRDYRDRSESSQRGDYRHHSRSSYGEGGHSSREARSENRGGSDRGMHSSYGSRGSSIGQPHRYSSRDVESDTLSKRPHYEAVGGFKRFPSIIVPKHPTPPKSVNLVTNYYKIEHNEANWRLYQYHVEIEPELIQVPTRRVLLRKPDVASQLPKYFQYDNRHTLYAIERLDADPKEIMTKLPTTGLDYKITIRLANEFCNEKEHLRLYNVLMKECLRLCGFVQVGPERSQADTTEQLTIWNTVSIMPGYTTGIQKHQNDEYLMCVNKSFRTFSTRSLSEVYESFKDRPNGRKLFEDYVFNSTVITLYNYRAYRIDSVEWDQNAFSTFTRNNVPITYEDYYKEMYGIQLKSLDHPLLIARSTERDKLKHKNRVAAGLAKPGDQRCVYLMPELCSLTGLQSIKEFEFNYRFKKDFDSFTKQKPQQCYDQWNKLIKRIKDQNRAKAELDNWCIGFNDTPLRLDSARVLDVNNIHFKNDPEELENNAADWGFRLKNSKLIRSFDIKRLFIFVVESSQANMDTFRTLENSIIQISLSMGFKIGLHNIARITLHHNHQIPPGIDEAMCVEKDKPDFILCAMNPVSPEIYKDIKLRCLVRYKVPCQIILATKMNNPRVTMSYLTKVVIQMQCKLGGEIWGVKFPESLKNVMVVGISTCRMKKRNAGEGMVLALVASMNGTEASGLNCTRWHNQCVIQEAGHTFANHLILQLSNALLNYKTHNGKFPTTVVVYREGIHEGQFEILKEFEIEQMKTALEKIGVEHGIKLVVICVQKRHNTKFFTVNDLKSDSFYIENPPQGTVVDSRIVKGVPDENGFGLYDFFLASHKAPIGALNSTHYFVLHNDNSLKAELLHDLTYKLTHLYYNWPGQINIPAPCMYSQKFASFIANSLQKLPEGDFFNEKLFYL